MSWLSALVDDERRWLDLVEWSWFPHPLVMVVVATALCALTLTAVALRGFFVEEPPLFCSAMSLVTPRKVAQQELVPSWCWRVPPILFLFVVYCCASFPFHPASSDWPNVLAATLVAYLTYGMMTLCITGIGILRVRRSEAELLTPREVASPFYYAFLVQCCDTGDPSSVLVSTLESLASHPYAAQQYIVIISIEADQESELVERAARAAVTAFGSSFFAAEVSVHAVHESSDDGCPGSRGWNAARAGEHVMAQFVKRRRMASDRIMCTVLESGTILSDRYIHRLDAMLSSWLSDPDAQLERRLEITIFSPYRACTPSAAPPALIASFDRLCSCAHLYGLARAAPLRFPSSCYSVSLTALDAVGMWDRGDAGIGADTHLALRLFFDTHGAARIVPIYEAYWRRSVPSAPSACGAMRYRFHQAVWDALGHVDLGYTLWRCRHTTEGETPLVLCRVAVVQMLEAFVVLWAVTLVVGTAAASTAASSVTHAPTSSSSSVGVVACTGLVLTAATSAAGEWISAHHPGSRPRWGLVASRCIALPAAALIFFVLPAFPALWTLLWRGRLQPLRTMPTREPAGTSFLKEERDPHGALGDELTVTLCQDTLAARTGVAPTAATKVFDPFGLTPSGPRAQVPPPPKFLPSHRVSDPPHPLGAGSCASLALV